jgi:hypothetical protein
MSEVVRIIIKGDPTMLDHTSAGAGRTLAVFDGMLITRPEDERLIFELRLSKWTTDSLNAIIYFALAIQAEKHTTDLSVAVELCPRWAEYYSADVLEDLLEADIATTVV